MRISSQDFRNAYEKFYRDIREYLWPYATLEELAHVEEDIYTTFIDIDKLRTHFRKLGSSLKPTVDEDEFLNKSYNELLELIEGEDTDMYAILPRVEEVNPDEDKQIRTIPEEDSDEEEFSEEQNSSFSFSKEDQG